jgi:uncharacterized phiE125 gp8 family phage protein
LGASIVTKPANEPVSLTEVKAHLRIDTSDSDMQLMGHIVAARQLVEAHLRRALITQTWNLKLDEWPSNYRIDVPLLPLQSVSSITYLNTSGDSTTLSTADYSVIGTGADNFGAIVPAFNTNWPETYYVPEAITVQFVAGYGSSHGEVPAPIRQAILFQVEILFDRHSKVLQGLGWKTALETTRDALLDPYRVVRL